MTCQELVELVTAYLEGALDASTRRQFDEHLALCPGCAIYLDQFRATIATLGMLPMDSLSTESRDSMLAAFRTWHRRG